MKDFYKFALSRGVGSNVVDEYNKYCTKNAYINPSVIEEKQNANMISIDIFSRLLMDRILFLGAEINSDVANIFIAQLLWMEQQSDDTVINVYINSPGGSVRDGLALIDCMDFVKPEISTTCVGTAASMAAVIFSNGTKGKRYMMPHGRVMIHQASGGIERSQCSDINIMAKEITALNNELYEILGKNSNLTVDEVASMADRDCWIRAEDALRYGLADKIINHGQ